MGHHDAAIPGGARPIQDLKEWRKAKGMTQEALARAVGIGRPTIADIEAGRHEPTLSTATKIAAALGIEIGWIRWPLAESIEPHKSKDTATSRERRQEFQTMVSQLDFDPTHLVNVPAQVQIEMAALLFTFQNGGRSASQAESDFRQRLHTLGFSTPFVEAALHFVKERA